MIDAVATVLSVRRVCEVAAGSLVWDAPIGSWSLVVETYRCADTGPSHPRRDDPCVVLVLSPVVAMLGHPGWGDRAVHFVPGYLVVVADVGEVFPDAGGG